MSDPTGPSKTGLPGEAKESSPAPESRPPWFRSQEFWFPLLLVALGILFFSDPLFSSKNFYFRDILNFHYPLRRVLIDAYARWEFPLWNPFIYLGQPMLANPNYMAFYPTNLFHLFLPFNYAFKLHFIVHPVLAGLGAYFFQRRLGILPLAALGGSLAYQFSGTLLSFLNLYNIVPAVALLPWIGWAFTGALKGNWLRRSLAFGALLAMQVIAFEPLMFQCVLWLLAGFAVLHLLEAEDRWKAAGAVVRVALVGAAFGFALAAIQVIPTLELLPRSARGELDFIETTRWSMHPLDFLNTLVPNLFGNYYEIGLPTSWGGSFHEGREGYLVSFFIGSCALLLASVSFTNKHKKLQGILAGLAFVSIFLALGRYNPVYYWLFKNVPYFALGRYPCKHFLLGTLMLCMMTSLGLEVVVNKESASSGIRGRSFGACGLLLAALFLGGWLYLQAHPAYLESLLRSEVGLAQSSTKDFPALMKLITQSILLSGVFLLLGGALILAAPISKHSLLPGGLLLLLIAAELIPANLRLSPLISDVDIDFVPEVNAYLQRNGPTELGRVVPPTLLRPMPDLHLRTPNRSSAWLTLFFRMSGQPFYGIMNGLQYSLDRSVDHLNTRESEKLWDTCSRLSEASALTLLEKLNSPLILSMQEIRDPRVGLIASFDTRSEFPLRAYWLDNTIGRAYFVSGVDFVNSSQEALNKCLRFDFPIGNTVVLEGQGESRIGDTGAGSAKVLEYHSSSVLCEVNAKTPGYMVLIDSYYPGWRAYVDGKRSEILKANYAFRAVAVPAGKHQVEYRYQPRSFYAGLTLTMLAALTGIALLIFYSRNSL